MTSLIQKRSTPDRLRHCAKALTDLGDLDVQIPTEMLATIGGVSFTLHMIADEMDSPTSNKEGEGL